MALAGLDRYSIVLNCVLNDSSEDLRMFSMLPELSCASRKTMYVSAIKNSAKERVWNNHLAITQTFEHYFSSTMAICSFARTLACILLTSLLFLLEVGAQLDKTTSTLEKNEGSRRLQGSGEGKTVHSCLLL